MAKKTTISMPASFLRKQAKQRNRLPRRVDNAWKSNWSMKSLMTGDLPLFLKCKHIDICILPILTYGAQTWSLIEAQKSRLKLCQRAMERSVFGTRLSDRQYIQYAPKLESLMWAIRLLG